jgi:putative ABC transport system permease protein
MRHLWTLAGKSAWNRRWTLGLTALAIAAAVTMLLAVERIRHDAREGFAQSVSGTDLVIGARTSPLQLLLYSVFRMGEASSNISWQSAQQIARHPLVAWSIPLSLGDSHRGFPVLGTTDAYFAHFRYGDKRELAFAAGQAFDGLFEAVIGAEVAQRLHYRVGDRITLSHGGELGAEHADKPFVVTGILRRTGTPVDRTVHVSLEAIQAIHLEWQGGAPMPGVKIAPEFVRKFDLTPTSVTAVLVGLHSRAAVFRMQRHVNEFAAEPLLAVLPGVALSQLWEVVGVVERTLLLVSALVVAVGLTGLVAVMLASLNERRRELAILRSVGAQPLHVLLLLVIEGIGVTLLGIAAGVALLALASGALGPVIEARYGFPLQTVWLTLQELRLLGMVLAVGLLASLVPGYRAYRLSLADGLVPRI